MLTFENGILKKYCKKQNITIEMSTTDHKDLNEDVNNAAKGEKFITFFAGHYNRLNNTLQYVNAGHNHPILVNSNNTIF